jgi:hypothetical protein
LCILKVEQMGGTILELRGDYLEVQFPEGRQISQGDIDALRDVTKRRVEIKYGNSEKK